MPPITLNDVRFSYVNVFQAKPPFNNPGGEPKFSVTVLVPKTNVHAKGLIDQAVAAAIDLGVTTKWNNVRPPQPAICVHDGDGVRPSDGQPFGEECKGCWVFTASANKDHPPFMVDAQVQNILDPTQIYSGMWGNISVSFFPYSNAGKKGVGCGLNGLQKVRDGEPLGSRVTAQDAFQAVGPGVPSFNVPPFGAGVPAAPVYGAPPAAPTPGQTSWGTSSNPYGW